MKLRHALGLVGVAVVLAAAAACNQPQRQNDWRSPSPAPAPTPTAHEQPRFLPTDGGAPPGPPIVQPSANDIQI
jgi:hypothetical protein